MYSMLLCWDPRAGCSQAHTAKLRGLGQGVVKRVSPAKHTRPQISITAQK